MANVRLQFAESLLSFQHNSYSVYVSERPCNEITYVKHCIHLGFRLNIRIEEFQGNECLAFSARNVFMMRYNDERRQSAQADLAKITSRPTCMWAYMEQNRDSIISFSVEFG